MSWKSLLILAVFIAIIYNLGAALYYMATRQSAEGRTARSLTWRIGLSVALVMLIIVGILTGVIEPHGIRVGH